MRVELKRQGQHDYSARIQKVFESIDDPQLELEIIAENHSLSTEFSDKVLSDTQDLKNLPAGKRRDLTHCAIVTIDGETAKDFDDAITVEKLKSGDYKLLVSIADVSHYVRPGTKLDREAFYRGTSVYFPGLCIPMLPEALSNDLCSLVPHQERLTITCEMLISSSGEILKSSVYPSIIKSQARLTYTQVGHLLENEARGLFTPEIESMLLQANELADILKNRRQRLGALDLDIAETQIEVNEAGDVLHIGPTVRNKAHRLIEDFMVIANECVSELIEEKGYASVFRIHERPDPEKMRLLEQLVKTWGFKKNFTSLSSSELQDFLKEVRGHPFEKSLVVSVLRSMKKAIYSTSNAGHFGLGSSSYCHFTSPIRRYPDLLIHRILSQSQFLKKEKMPIDSDSLAAMAEKCTLAERRAFLAERDMEDLKKCRFLAHYVGKTFDGLVTTVKEFGVFVEIEPYGIDGLIPLRLLPSSDWILDGSETQLSSRRRRTAFKLGDRVKIRVQNVDRLRRKIDFMYLEHSRDT